MSGKMKALVRLLLLAAISFAMPPVQSQGQGIAAVSHCPYTHMYTILDLYNYMASYKHLFAHTLRTAFRVSMSGGACSLKRSTDTLP